MARSLEGKWFHTCYNNGVEAIVSNEIYKNIRRKRQILVRLGVENDLLPHITEMPVFTFASKDRVDKSPWFTGTTSNISSLPEHRDLTRLLNYIDKNGGHFGSASFYVPFSNGCEAGLHGQEAQREELRYVTTDSQFEETFGISLGELRNSGDKYL